MLSTDARNWSGARYASFVLTTMALTKDKRRKKSSDYLSEAACNGLHGLKETFGEIVWMRKGQKAVRSDNVHVVRRGG